MTNQTELIREVRAALEAATPGPWTTWERNDVIQVVEKDGELSICDMDGGSWGVWQHNAALIANSPTWLQQLTDRLETAERQRDEANKAILKTVGDLMFVPTEIEKLKKQLAEAVKALEWYSDEQIYEQNEDAHRPEALEDVGLLARTTLKRIKGENG